MASIYQVVVTSAARQNLKDIIEYLGKNVSYETAERVRDGIEEEILQMEKSKKIILLLLLMTLALHKISCMHET